ncbi:chemotaxis protein CheW [Marmoricola sp. URHA0025 HA25]
MHALLLPVGTDLYALPVAWAREVVATPSVTPLATAPESVLGLFNLRGQIVPLLDTARLLGTGTVDTVAFAVVITSQHGLAGLATTAMPRREVLETSAGSSELPGTAGRYRLGHQVATLLDVGHLLNAGRSRGLDERAEVAGLGAP